MTTYDLAKMLEEIRRDERGGKQMGKVMTQEEIRALARGRRRKPATKPVAKPPKP